MLTFSPVGNLFRDRCRQFPSIINCTTIDWYNEWPEDALYSVAFSRLESVADQLQIREQLDAISKSAVQLHLSVREESEKYLNALRRHNYVTPTSYLALMSIFLKELENQRRKIPAQIQTYQSGLTRLEETNVIVDKLKASLIELMPMIKQKEEETQVMVLEVQEKTKQAKEKEAVVSKEEAEAKKLFNAAKEIQTNCDNILS